MEFKISCQSCGKILWFSTEFAGQTTICPACGAVNLLPELPGAMEESAPAAAAQAVDADDWVNMEQVSAPVVAVRSFQLIRWSPMVPIGLSVFASTMTNTISLSLLF